MISSADLSIQIMEQNFKPNRVKPTCIEIFYEGAKRSILRLKQRRVKILIETTNEDETKN